MVVKSLILLVLKTSIALSVFALGLKSTFADTVYVFRRPRQLVCEFLSMNVAMPLIAVVLVIRFNLSPPVKIALIALSASPVPPLFPKKALQGRGQENYTLGLLVAAALLAVIVVPATMHIFENIVGVPLRMSARAIALLVFKTILAPLLAGIVLRASVPSFAARTSEKIGTVASVLLVLGILPVLIFSARPMLSLVGNGTLLSLAVFVVAGYIVGYLLGGREPESRHALALATANRHPGVALAIASANFPAQKLAAPAVALYLIVAGLVSLLLGRRSRARTELAPGNRRAA
jgi:bile acid:Na+ symporter, BASS family